MYMYMYRNYVYMYMYMHILLVLCSVLVPSVDGVALIPGLPCCACVGIVRGRNFSVLSTPAQNTHNWEGLESRLWMGCFSFQWPLMWFKVIF